MSNDNPASVLFDSNSVELSVTASVAIPTSASAIIVAGVGTDGIVRYPVIDSSGLLHVSMSLAAVTGSVRLSQTATVTGSIALTEVVTVKGQYASGSVTFGNPLFIAGSDGTTLHPILTDGSGRIVTTQKAASSSITPISASASNTQLLAANASRLGASIYNGADQTMYVALGNTLTTESYSVKVAVDQYYEVPFGYTGVLYAVWDSGPEGYAQVTEVV